MCIKPCGNLLCNKAKLVSKVMGSSANTSSSGVMTPQDGHISRAFPHAIAIFMVVPSTMLGMLLCVLPNDALFFRIVDFLVFLLIWNMFLFLYLFVNYIKIKILLLQLLFLVIF